MPFVRSGKKAAQKRDRDSKLEAVDPLIDRAVSATRVAIGDAKRCLPMCFLAQRILAQVLPARPFALRLGSLHVYPLDEKQKLGSICFDPRSQGIDGGFHCWLEDGDQQLLDPSIYATLVADGYPVDGAAYLLDGGRDFRVNGLRFIYEELLELELLGVEESEPHLGQLMALAMRGEPLRSKGKIHLDVGWRASTPRCP